MPELKILTGTGAGAPPGQVGYKARRVWVFLAVFIPCMLLGQVLNYARDPLFRSTATVLTVAAPSVDQTASPDELDLQHVAIQRQLLLGRPLLTRTVAALRQAGVETLPISRVRRMLSVTPVPSTHLVEMAAIGNEAQLLPLLVNTWIEAYLVFREHAVKREVGDTLEILGNQHLGLKKRLQGKREEVLDFAAQHDILSQGRSENQAHAKLQGLNEALNEARETEIQAQADYDALLAAIESGEPLVPANEQASLVEMQVQLEALRLQLREFDSRYTRRYRLVNPEFEDLPDQIKALHQSIEHKLLQGQRMLKAEAWQRLQSALAGSQELERRLFMHKREAAQFSAHFAQYQAMTEDLEALEAMSRELEQRMAGIQSSSLEKYPQVRVVDWAYRPTTPFHPDYGRDALLIGIGALLLAVLAVWLLDFLRRDPNSSQTPAAVPMTGIRVYTDAQRTLEGADQTPALSGRTQLAHNIPSGALATLASRELTQPEIQALWQAADAAIRTYLCLLLSGLNPDEASAFSEGDFDPDGGRLRVRGPGDRTLVLEHSLHRYLEGAGVAPGREALEADIRLLAYDAGLPYPQQIDAGVICHSYILYLVRQGARLRELEQILGPISPQTLTAFAPYSPQGPGRPLHDLDLSYPLDL